MTDVLGLLPVFRVMAEVGLLLLVHGESTSPDVDIFDRESHFLPILDQVLKEVPELKCVLEHVTTRDGIEFIKRHAKEAIDSNRTCRVGGTLTAHHLMHTRNDLFEGGLQTHLYCLPIYKTSRDRAALLDALFDPTYGFLFFLGTDSAPHPRSRKECGDGCSAGCFTGHATVELYLETLMKEGERRGQSHEETERVCQEFMTSRGARFYGIELNADREIIIDRIPNKVPDTLVRHMTHR